MNRRQSEQPSHSSLLLHITQHCLGKLIPETGRFAGSRPEAGVIGFLLGAADRGRITAQDAVIAECAFSEEQVFVSGGCLDNALQKWRNATNQASAETWLDVVGWFVFHGPDAPELSPSEIEFHNRRFSGTGSVILVFRQLSSDEILTTAISALPDAALTRSTQLRAFTAIRGAVPKRPLTLRLRETVTDESYARAYQVVGSLDRAERRQEWRDMALSLMRRRSFLLGAALCVFALSAAVVWLVFGSPESGTHDSAPQASIHADLGLRIESLADSLMITWNRQAPAVLAATSGVLHVEDGTEQRDINLSQVQVANGVVLYKPQSAPVNVQLVLHDRTGKNWNDSIRATGPGVK